MGGIACKPSHTREISAGLGGGGSRTPTRLQPYGCRCATVLRAVPLAPPDCTGRMPPLLRGPTLAPPTLLLCCLCSAAARAAWNTMELPRTMSDGEAPAKSISIDFSAAGSPLTMVYGVDRGPQCQGVPPFTPEGGKHPQDTGADSHWRDCHFADVLSPSLLIHLLKLEGGAAE